MYKNYKDKEENNLYFYHPITGKYRISSPFGKRGNNFHDACDYVALENKTLRAVGHTIVSAVGFEKGGGGNFVKLKSLWYKDSVEMTYCHLDKIFIKVGDVLNGKDAIGVEGSTGHSTGDHLHFRIKLNGRAINPEGGIVKWV